ncbi:helix-turn-helix transcriptional regulator [Streptomyces sp. WAC01280]|uniref:helix-turn-helix domain-containing protein n=1 Tax=Streptomyces sp. WAC01280 TaxID=2487424 RepID=UPI000F786404|nr:helix-turn-helix transcriptional regulator [Streptomyces sp. WAC01280]RSS57451.1 XRE family transcriptional regulator [Streptomyces sp. WAC01280]
MGRTENPINYELPTRGRLAELLRAEKAGRTYDELATLTGVSPATLKRAASGKVVPAEKVIDAFLEACGSGSRTVRTAKSLRVQARRDERGGPIRVLATTVNTGDALADALEALYRNAGAPTYREMQKSAGGAYLLPLSSISRILGRKMLPVDEQQLVAFLRGCRVPQREHGEWVEAWRRGMGLSSSLIDFRKLKPVIDAIQRLSADARRFDALGAGVAAGVLPLLEVAEKGMDTSRLAAGIAPVVAAAEQLSRSRWAAAQLASHCELPPEALGTAA